MEVFPFIFDINDCKFMVSISNTSPSIFPYLPTYLPTYPNTPTN